MRTELITDLADLEAIADEWNGLALPSPMQSPDWLIPWWQVYGTQGRELAVLAIRGYDDQLLGLCPWYAESRPMGRCLRWLGDGAACSDHAGLLAAPDATDEVIRAVSGWLRDSSSFCAQILFESADADDTLLTRQLALLRSVDWLFNERSQPGSSWIALPATWEEYLASVSKNHRKRCRKWQKELFDTGQATVEVVTEPGECLQKYDLLVQLHNSRQQAVGQRGAFEDNDFRVFHRLAVRRLAESGRLQLRLLSLDGQLAAIEYVLVDSEAVYAYQSGMSAAGEEASAGNLSILALIRDAIQDGRRRVDFLRGTEPYKFSWGAVHRPASDILVRRRSLAGVMQACFDSALQRAREVKKSVAKRRG